jgi:hypothetical protein
MQDYFCLRSHSFPRNEKTIAVLGSHIYDMRYAVLPDVGN